ncbi:hypothetical protein B296_00032848 [Ensete ventricosum]|uniref:Late embryogenesis abundant protein LEA-2 subgroup domain-containing protein n=1 Tax=Ensete ventricosum TaxID=4639 RepID=A0A426XUH5_ENSVE|nr:hypothetical protein B296_00032848 [Ensete ventricosum]
MADRVYPSAKPNPHPPQPLNGGGPALPPTKSQINSATRLPYRPQPKPRRSRRGLCCSCCLWFIMLLVVLVILAAIAGGVFYAIYRPRRPAFSVSVLRIAALNVSAAGHLSSRVDLNVTARNPNKKLIYFYDPISVSVLSGGVDIGDGSIPAFVHDAGSATVLSATTSSSAGQTLDSAAGNDLRKSSSLPLEVDMDTEAGVKIGGLKTKKIGIKVRCAGIRAPVPKAKASAAVSPGDGCMVKLRIKIGKWTL